MARSIQDVGSRTGSFSSLNVNDKTVHWYDSLFLTAYNSKKTGCFGRISQDIKVCNNNQLTSYMQESDNAPVAITCLQSWTESMKQNSCSKELCTPNRKGECTTNGLRLGRWRWQSLVDKCFCESLWKTHHAIRSTNLHNNKRCHYQHNPFSQMPVNNS